MLVIARYLLLISLSFIFPYQLFADEVLWESGQNLFIKITPQDKSKSGKTLPNSHPVKLNQADIAEALELIKIWTKDYYEGEELERVFTVAVSRQIAEHTAKGLLKAKPNEDIIFTLVASKKGMFGTSEPRWCTGRVFYLDNKLNVILGEYDHAGDKLKEIVYAGTGTQTVKYFFPTAKRAKASKSFTSNIMKSDAIENRKVGSKIRKDWFVIDLEKTKQIITANKNVKRKSSVEYQQSLEKAKLAKERREMRLEMARIRNEMKKNKSTSNKSIEQRLEDLKSLKEKGLILDEEYQKKRTEILNDI